MQFFQWASETSHFVVNDVYEIRCLYAYFQYIFLFLS